MGQVTIYYPKHLYDTDYRGHLFPLLKPFLKNKNYSDAERINLYGISSKDIKIISDPLKAQILIVPMSWNYYLLNNRKREVVGFLKKYSKLGKKIFIYNSGDIGLKIPHFENVLVFRLTVNKLPKEQNVIIIPPFISDPLKSFFDPSALELRKYEEQPVIGFCGFAKTSKKDAAIELLKIMFQNLLSHLTIRNEEPQQFLSSSFFRGRLLKILSNANNLRTNFIVRDNYRAGVKSGNKSHPTVSEFYDNMKNSDYILCARGSGNFSIRFYETLAMGRIPVYVNTEGALPLEDIITWKDHVVWVEQKEIVHLEKKVLDFHNKMNSRTFQNLLRSNRELWEEKLTLGSYFSSIFASIISHEESQ